MRLQFFDEAYGYLPGDKVKVAAEPDGINVNWLLPYTICRVVSFVFGEGDNVIGVIVHPVDACSSGPWIIYQLDRVRRIS